MEHQFLPVKLRQDSTHFPIRGFTMKHLKHKPQVFHSDGSLFKKKKKIVISIFILNKYVA